LKESKIIYLQGQNGQFVNMDIDCDGVQGGPADDGRCQSSNDTQSQTTFQWDVEHYNAGQKDLDANVHPYVVFGNEGEKPNWPTFDPQKHGIEPLSIMAVVCNNQLVS
jgi:glycosyl hydrolase group 75 (putative chitosanase)